MGWWSDDVLGGDTPLDVLGDIAETLDMESLYPLCDIDKGKVSTAINQNWMPLLNVLEKYNDGYSDSGMIAIQVFATVIMESGANMPERFKASAILAGEKDEWAKEDDGRGREMKKYIDAVKAYNGSPSSLEHTSLLERLAEVLG